jgi:hypothetical protein
VEYSSGATRYVFFVFVVFVVGVVGVFRRTTFAFINHRTPTRFISYERSHTPPKFFFFIFFFVFFFFIFVIIIIIINSKGVLCPGDDGSNNNNAYVYDDHYFDCGLDGATIPLTLVPNNAEEVTHTYSCYNGRNCYGKECNITFDDVTLTAEPARFANRCTFLGQTNANNSNVTTTAVAISAAPTPPPVLQRRQIVAEFRLGLGMERYVDANDDTSAGVNPLTCAIDRPDVTIRCTNGIIKFVESTLAVNPCAQPDDATLVCNRDATGPATLSEGDLHNITYVRISCVS